MKENLKTYYQYFYKKVFKKRIGLTEKNLKTIESFNKLLQKEYGESIGEDWLFEYLTYQFNKFHSAETKMNLQMNWVYGKKALENFKNRHDESSYFNQKFRHEFNIKKIFDKEEQALSKEYKHRERVKYRDERQILHCFILDLFDENSADCKFCKNKGYCLKL